MNKDTQRFNWLSKQYGAALVNDDNGHWAVSYDGFQNVVTGKRGHDVQTAFFIKAKDWKQTPRKAVDAAIKANDNKK